MFSPEINIISYIRRYDLDKTVEEIEKAFKCEALMSLFKTIDSYVDKAVKALEEQGYAIIHDRRLALKTRLVLYFRGFELPWDPYWNVPYLPASMIAEALRLAAWRIGRQCFSVKDLGTLEEKSPIAVLDAYPIFCPHSHSMIVADYIEEEGMCELDTPRRLPMLTIATNTVFRFVIVKKERLSCPEDKLFDELYLALRIALRRGIGALLPLGYGIFDVDLN